MRTAGSGKRETMASSNLKGTNKDWGKQSMNSTSTKRESMNPFSPNKDSMYGSPDKNGNRTVFSSMEKTTR